MRLSSFVLKRMFTKGDPSLPHNDLSPWEQRAVPLEEGQGTHERQHVGILSSNIPWQSLLISITNVYHILIYLLPFGFIFIWGKAISSSVCLVSGSDGKESACSVGDLGLIPGSERSPGEGNGSPRQYPCLESPMDRGAWRATVHGVAGSDTTERLSLSLPGLSLPPPGEYPSLSTPSLFTYWEPEKQLNNPIRHYTK